MHRRGTGSLPPTSRSRETTTRADRERLNLIGQSEVFLRTVERIERLAACDATTLIEGETGTGKEVAARAIHYLSRRREFPFIPVHCGALPDSLLEAELFGYEKGAFTDAKERRAGLITEADGGTLFLDEVEAMSPRAQVVLLRFLQDQSYRAVGGRTLRRADVRIIAATNAELPELVARGEFRQDLWFRLHVLQLSLPPLRERDGDPVFLARHFIARNAASHGRPPKRLHPDSVAWLERHSWPGNVRELETLILREFLLGDGNEIRIREAPVWPTPRSTIRAALPAPPSLSVETDDLCFEPTRLAAEADDVRFEPTFRNAKAIAVANFEQRYLRQLLAKTGGNISRAARLAHKDRSALNKLVRKYGIVCEDFRRARAPRDGAPKKRVARGG